MQNKKSAEQVLARRLRPIYDAIDANQYKKAILEAEKVLKKHPQTHTARALKALALIRTDRSLEALPILNTLEENIFVDEEFDENTIQAICHCYKEVNNPTQIETLYSKLAKRYPANEKLQRELFFSHVRTRNYRKQQQVAMQLYKETNLLQYYCWAVISVLMQGISNKQLGRSMFFPLAEKMVNKLQVEELYQMQGGFDLHLLVLELMEKYGQAIETLETNLRYTVDSYSDEQLKQHLDRFYRMNREVNAHLERSLRAVDNEPNEWSNWVNLAENTILKMKSVPEEQQQRIVNRTIEQWRQVFHSYSSDAEDSSAVAEPCRGPLLGRLLLLKELLTANLMTAEQLANSPLGTPLGAAKELAAVVAHKPFAFADLQPFLHLIDDQNSQELLDFVAHLKEKSWDSAWPAILWEQLQLHFHPPFTLAGGAYLCLFLVFPYVLFQSSDALPAAVRHLLTQMASNDGPRLNGMQVTAFTQVLIQYVWHWWTQKSQINVLLALIAFVERVWADYEDSCTASIAIALCRFYGVFGDIGRIRNLEKQIQLKFIQRDSLAFLHFFLPYQFGRFKSANIFFTSLGSMYDVNEREVNECLVSAYKNAAFYQITKLVDFASRSSNSLFSIGADILNRCVSGCFTVSPEFAAATLVGDNQNIDWDSLADNRDFSVLPIIVRSSELQDLQSERNLAKVREFSFSEMKNYFKLHHSLMVAIGHIGTDRLGDKAAQFLETLEECRKLFPQSNGMENNFANFVNLELHSLVSLDNKLFDLPCLVIDLALNLSKEMKTSEKKELDVNALRKKFTAALAVPLKEVDQFYRKGDVTTVQGRIAALKRASTTVQLLALSLIGYRLLEKMLANKCATIKNGSVSGGKKAEKPPQQQQKGSVAEMFAHCLQSVQAFLVQNFKKKVSIEGSTIDQDGWEELFTEPAKQQIASMQRRVIESINVAHSIDELHDAIGHLLDNYCRQG